jgi:hypothetical protein
MRDIPRAVTAVGRRRQLFADVFHFHLRFFVSIDVGYSFGAEEDFIDF